MILHPKRPRYIRTKVALSKQVVSVYSGKQLAPALNAIGNAPAFEGVKILQLMEAVYEQGKKDGARSVFDAVDALKGQIPHRNPGQPKKRVN